jgi:hypothetical protein
MFRIQNPIVGAWFVNVTGQLIKVRLVMYDKDMLHRVLIQNLDGTMKLITTDDWFCLKLDKQIREVGLSSQFR